MIEHAGLYAPGLVVIAGGAAVDVKRVDPDLVTVFNTRTERYEIYDRLVKPRWQLVMRVQEEDGSYRPLDGRVLPPLYEARGRSVDELLDQMEIRDNGIEDWMTKQARNLGEDMYEIFWSLGKRVVPTIAWRDRTPPEVRARLREKIRAAGTPHEAALA